MRTLTKKGSAGHHEAGAGVPYPLGAFHGVDAGRPIAHLEDPALGSGAWDDDTGLDDVADAVARRVLVTDGFGVSLR